MLAHLLKSEFAANLQVNGRSYFERGAVRLTDRGENFAVATVRGTELYDVDLHLNRGVLHLYCSCPYYRQHAAPCKHLWATILKIDATGGLPDAAGLKRVRLELEDDDDGSYGFDHDEFEPEFESNDDDGFQPDDEIYRPEPQWPMYVGSRSATRKPTWKDQLRQVRDARLGDTAAHPWPSGREILYVVDVPASLQRGGLAISLLYRQIKQDGEWGKPMVEGIDAHRALTLPDPQDRRIVTALHGAAPLSYGYFGQGGSNFALSGTLLDDLLPQMAATGRLYVRPTKDRTDMRPLTWDDGPAWELALTVALSDSAKSYVLTGSLRRGDQVEPLDRAVLLVSGAVVWPDRIARFNDAGAFPWVALLRRDGRLVVPLRDKDKLVAELVSLPVLPRLELPEELRYQEVALPPRPRLLIKPSTSGWGRDRLEAHLSFVYGEQTVAAWPRTRGAYDPAARQLLLRDLPAEQAAADQLPTVGVQPQPTYGYHEPGRAFELRPRQLTRVVAALVEAGWQVEADGSLYRKPGEFKLNVESSIDWFDVHAAVDFEGQPVPLPTLLAALRRGEKTVRLDDGSMGMLPEDWLKKYGLLARMGTVEGDRLRFRRTQVGLLDALLADQPAVTLDAAFIKARDELRRFDRIEPVEAPAAFTGQLRHYQRDGLGWLHFLQRFGLGGCLADDMGLGKTVQVLALLANRRASKSKDRPPPSLVVVPRSLIFNWKQEAARFAPHLRVLDHTGLGRSKSAEAFSEYDLVLTTYGTLRRDVLLFKDVTFDYCILDESQAVKNADSESAKAVRLLKGHHRLALSGTPVENHLGELWSLFEFLNPGMLGQAAAFQLGVNQRNPDPESRTLLARALRPFILRRTKDQVAPELPAKTEQTLYCDLEPAQRKLYDELRDHYRQSLLGKLDGDLRRAKIQVLEALLRLRQAACHPGLIDKKRAGAGSAKLEMLLPQLRDVIGEGHKALVFSQFTSLLALVRTHLDAEGIAYEYLDGRTRDRAARVDRFQNDAACRLFLVSLKAGGVGLNLTAAEYVYLLDPWWNPAVEAQAIDRTHRIGQERPVFAYRLIARDTVEEKVLELQQTKRALADAIIGADNSLIRDLKREDLELLLS